ncbi:MAG: SIS domain-containing protein, partial [Clostridia bacterium]|nr:SIS domain-containing protein [Clostridia bacterium]
IFAAFTTFSEFPDVLIAISTSGNSENVVNAAKIAKWKGMRVISLVGKKACALDALSDVTLHVAENETYLVQELHLPAYHWLCTRVEAEFFAE